MMVQVILDLILDQMHCWTRPLSLHLEQLPYTILMEIVDLILEDTNPCFLEDQDAAYLVDLVQDLTILAHPHVVYLEDQHQLEDAVTPDQCPDQVFVHPPV